MKLRVVIFDDDENVLDAMSMLVKRLGHEALCYSDPTLCPLYSDPSCKCTREEACADILITDNKMPKMTGLEFLQQQALRGCKGIMRHKAVMSGSWSSEEFELAKSLGCRIFYKPMNVREVMDWLKECEQTISSERKLVNLPSEITSKS